MSGRIGRGRMGGRRRNEIVMGLAVVMILGTAVYFRLWTIDYSASSYDADLLRRQFDLANREALDESAEWRLRYDEEAERTAQCLNELKQVKESSRKDDNTGNINQKLEMLQKENTALVERVEVLKQELEAVKLKCNSH
ncbi:acyl-CoA-binding domain protein [Parasponia andersonii]|uniref:Acyl-CoA-binding domain protein n=1 Tax=Parasponia andersonii TaxID=3476 RepID=A0A2P5D7N1_PARAD|nr:acyl-CoA-binding domain protein [Parasponia andersonii]